MNTFDPIWETKYAAGHAQRYPWDCVVSFVYRQAPRDRSRGNGNVLEVGCRTGLNLWFAAREGFAVAGLDASPSAFDAARRRFETEGLQGDLWVGLCHELPWEDESVDLAIDRWSLMRVGHAVQRQAVAEVYRVLRPGGVFFSNGYSERHSSAQAGVRQPDGRVTGIARGTLVGAGGLHFSTHGDIETLFADLGEILVLEHVEVENLALMDERRHTEWRIVARKT